ncbi:hypothetical protein [Streptomyces sp. PU_AKi4]|uniref:hypothetical protein n=1 Tax=Streptomyces sp. PU_AKi4 TaxID=2800809 RepID=UPI003526892B
MNRATPFTASALSLLTALSLTACGGDRQPDNSTGEPRPSTYRADKVPPAERLAELVVTPAEVDGFSVKEPTSEFVFAESPEEVTVDKPDCAPLAYAMNQLPLGDPQADLTRTLAEKAKGYSSAYTYITLTSYVADGAESSMAAVKQAVKSCGNGFTASAGSGTSTYESVTAEEVEPAGDEALGFKSTMTFQGTPHTLHTEVVRRGDVLGVYVSVNGMAIANAEPSDAKLPPTVVKAQNAKLG